MSVGREDNLPISRFSSLKSDCFCVEVRNLILEFLSPLTTKLSILFYSVLSCCLLHSFNKTFEKLVLKGKVTATEGKNRETYTDRNRGGWGSFLHWFTCHIAARAMSGPG